MNRQYLIRLDDACPTMDRTKWQRMEDILDRYSIKPLVGVIPHNEDQMQQIDPADENFWDKVKNWEKKGWAIALHGYNHSYTSNGGLKGLNPLWERSEFAGLSLDDQKKKIRDGVAIMLEHGINPKYFFAPSHTFDKNTLEALREESDIRIISDTIAMKPYRFENFVFIPQFSGHCREMKLNGVFTFCLHPSLMHETLFVETESFFRQFQSSITNYSELSINNVGKKSTVDKLLSLMYFTYRHFRQLK